MSTEPDFNPDDRPPATPPQSVPPVEPTSPASGTTVEPVPAATISKEQKDKKLIAGILAILLGWLGIHKFYLDYQKEGIIMLVVGLIGFVLCGTTTAVVAIIGIVEGVLYLTKTDEEFVRTYLTGRKPWF